MCVCVFAGGVWGSIYQQVFLNWGEAIKSLVGVEGNLSNNELKVGLSPSKEIYFICLNETPLKR